MKRLKVITSYVGVHRFLQGLTAVGWIPRHTEIPSPYSFGPTHPVYNWKRGHDVIIVETRHKRYEVFHVVEQVYATDDEATEAYMMIKEARG